MNINRFGPLPIPMPLYDAEDKGGGEGDKKVEGAAGDGKEGAGDDKGGDKSQDKGGSKTALDGGEDDGGGEKAGAADWPDDWRDRMAGGDKNLRKALDRYGAPGDVGKELFKANQKLRAGRVDTDEAMPDPATDAEGAKKWRADRGIPEDATGYKVPDALQKNITDEDKPTVAAYSEMAHKNGWTDKQFGQGLEMYFGFAQQQLDAQAALDTEGKTATRDALRDEWGPEFKANSKLAKAVMDAIAPGLENARLPDGRLVGNVPEIIKGLAERGREYYGDVTFAGAEATKTTTDRLTQLRTIMRDEPEKWNANNADGKALRAEFDDLIEKQERAKGARARDKEKA